MQDKWGKCYACKRAGYASACKIHYEKQEKTNQGIYCSNKTFIVCLLTFTLLNGINFFTQRLGTQLQVNVNTQNKVFDGNEIKLLE